MRFRTRVGVSPPPDTFLGDELGLETEEWKRRVLTAVCLAAIAFHLSLLVPQGRALITPVLWHASLATIADVLWLVVLDPR